MNLQKLFEPIQIGKITVRNRVAMAPMVCAYTDRGYVSEQQIAYYAARARGGVGLIITEHALTSRWSEDHCPLNVMGVYHPAHMLGLAELVDTIHAFGARTFIQLGVGLGVQGSSALTGVQPVAPSAVGYKAEPDTLPKNVLSPLEGEVPREMTVAEIGREQDQFVRAAVMARLAGYDGVEIHAAHGFLLHDFLSPRFNRRTDRYGGTLENRMRFLVEIIRKTRLALGSDMVIGVRLSIQEPYGTTCEDTQAIAQRLEAEGVDYIHLGNGSFEALHWLLPDRDGTMLPSAAGIKKGLRIPVITPSVHDPNTAACAVSEGITDLVSLGRQLIADPEWANKVASGRLAEIRKCNRCNIGCYARLFQGLRVKCVLNPESGLEKYNPEYTRWAAVNR